jgi:anti-sigma regulatory factor (Ser/Thr protein kinase)
MPDHSAAQAGQTRVSAHFPENPISAGRARRMVARACRDWDVPHVSDDAELVVTELVENAIRHARTGCDIDIELFGGELRISARDGSTAPPRRVYPDPTRPGGRGLLLIEKLCRDWGFELTDHGKRVWTVLSAGDPRHVANIGGVGSSFTIRKHT